MTVRFSAVYGRPLGEPKSSGNTYTWCAWWTGEPCMAPFTPPDAFGGAPSRADVPGLVQQVASAVAELKWLPAYWAQEWRNVQRHGVEARAQVHAQHEHQRQEWEREARERAADPLWQWHVRQQAAQWVAFRDSLTDAATPEWAALLGLSLPFTEADLAAAWKAKAFDAHPDRGGSHDAFVALGRARDAAIAYLGAP